jgi:hypothetical protein
MAGNYLFDIFIPQRDIIRREGEEQKKIRVG